VLANNFYHSSLLQQRPTHRLFQEDRW